MRFRNAILFVALAVVWGSAFTAIKAGLEYFPPILFAALRYDLAGVIMLGYAAVATDRWRPRTRAEVTAVGIGGSLMIAAYHAFLFVGEQGTTSAVAAIVVSLSPILTTGFARALLPEERLTPAGVVALLIGLVGVGILADPDPTALVDSQVISLLLVFVAAVSFALGSVLTRRVDAELPIETMEAWSMILGALIMHAASLALAESPGAIVWTPSAALALAYLVVVASAIGFLIYFDLLERLGPIEINLVSYAAPLAAAGTGVIVLGETPTTATAGGFLLVFTAFVVLKRDALREWVARQRRAG